ncbi:MAG TPA: magnesium chelatase [Chloroflexi bacterium]|nr:magnesium chelatase [Chloroflexota bacterium]
MKLGLLLAVINPAVGGALLFGARGTAKTTAARALADLLPKVPRSLCFYGCLPEDIEQGGIDAVCPDCARKYAEGKPLAVMDRVRLVELPLHAPLDDVLGRFDARNPHRIRKGILALADRNLLYVDEVNLLEDAVADAILDAAAQGHYTVRRGALAATYRARFVLIASMNPEEGALRPQILDRFGLRLWVQGLTDPAERLEAYRRARAYREHPRQFLARYAEETEALRAEIQEARQRLPEVEIADEVAALGLQWVARLGIPSLRAEVALFEAARAHAAADGRTEVTPDDLRKVAPLALRFRRSDFMASYARQRADEEALLTEAMREA